VALKSDPEPLLEEVLRVIPVLGTFLRRRWWLLDARLTREALQWPSSTMAYAGMSCCS
jgi:hypothetical protein